MIRSLAVLAAICATCAGTAVGDDDPQPSPVRNLQELDERLAAAFAKSGIPGASVTIIEDYDIVFSKGYGVSDVETKTPVTTETVFRAGSISKSLTGIAIMLLVEEGKLRLDDELKTLLPELTFNNPWEATDPVRLVHLLEHTTGFDDIAFQHYLIDGRGMPLAEAIEQYAPYKCRWKPGTRMSYCNAGPVIAGRILEKVSGEQFQDFVARRLTHPLQMESACWTLEPRIAGRLSKSYQEDGRTLEPFMEIPGRPSGSLNVTSKDLARLPLLMLGRGTLDGITFFTPETADRIEFPQTTNAARAGLKHGYGLGNLAYPGKKAVFHGHDGSIDGFVAKYEYAPELGAGFVIMANALNDDALTLADVVKDYLERDLFEVESSDVPVPADDSARWCGQYQTATPRQQLFALITSLGQWDGVIHEDSSLSYKGVRRLYRGSGLFQTPGKSAVPNLVFVDEPTEVVLYAATGAYRRVPAWEMWAKVVYLGAFSVMTAVNLILLFVWIPSSIRGRLAERGGLTIRLLPALALFSVVALGGLAMFLISTGDLDIIGRCSFGASVAYLLSLAVPVLAVVALWRAFVGSSNANRWIKGLARASALLAVVAAIYLYQYGWVGLRIWAPFS